MSARSANHGMIQLVAREIGDHETIRSMTFGGVVVHLDSEGQAVAVDVPPSWSLSIVGGCDPR